MENQTQNNPKPKTTRNIALWYSLARRAALVAGLFAVIVAILLTVNYLQTRSIDPLKIEAINKLTEQLKENPENIELKEQIRALDLLARKAFFINRWQIRTGSYLLFGFSLIFLLALKSMHAMKTRFPEFLKAASPADSWAEKLLARKYVLRIALGIFILVIVLGFTSESILDTIGKKDPEAVNQGADYPSVEEFRKNWPGFRGPEGIGVSHQANIPVSWDGQSGKNILWRLKIPLPGFNSPIIWGDKIFLSGADKKNQVVYCIESGGGKILWSMKIQDVPGSPQKPPKTTDDTGYAASTMTTDGKRLYVIFATGDVAGLDFSGKVLWAQNLGVPSNHYGHSSSLITYQDLLLLQYDQNSGGRLIALKGATGKKVYDTPRDVQISWASPILVNTGKRWEVILNSNPYLISYNPRNGKELWRVKCMMGEVAPSPAYTNGIVFAVNENAQLVAVKLDNPGKIAWAHDDDLAEVSSPLASGKYLFMAASYGSLSCYDTDSGKQLWLHEYDQGFYSSPILNNGKIYLTDMNGITYIIKAEEKFNQLGENKLGEKVVATPAFMDKRIFIRGYRHLFAIGE